MRGARRRWGVVTSFDAEVGLGEVAGGGGGGAISGGEVGGGKMGGVGRPSWPFHCTQIAGGTRVIDVGARVSFEVVAGRRGRWEAADLRPEGPEGVEG